jgi:hypothetical protein
MRHTLATFTLLAMPLFATPALAQDLFPMPSAKAGGGHGGGGGGYRSFAVTMPLSFSRETNGHLEANLAGKATVSVEGGVRRKGDDVTAKETSETSESIESEGRGGAILISRYSDGMSMSGFYWGLGVGYREIDATWTVKPEGDDPQVNSYYLNQSDGTLRHRAQLRGTTGHIRGGYRYVGEEIPFTIGAFVGARHFQAGVKDAEADEDSRDSSRTVDDAAMTDREKERLRRRYTTSPELALELGWAF